MQYPKYNRFYTDGQAESPRDTEIDRRGDKQTDKDGSVRLSFGWAVYYAVMNL